MTRTRESEERVVVLGAGPAGLSAAAALRRRGISPLVLERADRAGSSWPARYDGLRLNSSRHVSGVPGVPIPRSAGMFPSRDAYAEYLAGCVERLGLDVRYGVEATRVDRRGAGWAVETSEGVVPASSVVVATGYDREARLPEWPGRDEFAGARLHASRFRNPAP